MLDEEIKQGSAALEEAEQSAAKAKEAVKDEHFADMTGEEAAAKAVEITAAVQAGAEKRNRLKRRVFPLSAIFLLFAALLSVSTYFVTHNVPLSAALAAAVCAAVAAGAVLAHFQAKGIEKQNITLLSPYGVQTPEELTALAQNYRERCQASDKAAHEAEVIRNAVTERETKRETTKAQLLEFVHGFAPEAQGMFGCSAALSRALSLDHDLTLARDRVAERRRRLDDLTAQGAGPEEPEAGEVPELPIPDLGPQETDQALARVAGRLEQVTARLNQARGTLQAMGDPAALSARAERLEGELSRRRLEYDALSAAMDALTQAGARLQERFSPELNRLTGLYMARLTGERYSAVSLSRELEGFVRAEEDVLPRSALYLSRGTADQLYLALRLAVCSLCLPERPPIFLDDALSSFDDVRLEGALELLWELSGKQQILLFTCQKREGEVLSNAPGVITLEL